MTVEVGVERGAAECAESRREVAEAESRKLEGSGRIRSAEDGVVAAAVEDGTEIAAADGGLRAIEGWSEVEEVGRAAAETTREGADPIAQAAAAVQGPSQTSSDLEEAGLLPTKVEDVSPTGTEELSEADSGKGESCHARREEEEVLEARTSKRFDGREFARHLDGVMVIPKAAVEVEEAEEVSSKLEVTDPGEIARNGQLELC